MPKKVKSKRTACRKYRALLSNGTDRRDDDEFHVWARSQQEAEDKVRAVGWDRQRFSLRGVYAVADLRRG